MKNDKLRDKIFSVRLPRYLYKDLQEESKKTYKSMNLLIIEALQDYLETK